MEPVSLVISGPLAMGLCVFLAAMFVSSLYIWKASDTADRNHPSVVKQRFLSIGCCCVLSPLIVAWFARPDPVPVVAC
jgi:hypothetical protein